VFGTTPIRATTPRRRGTLLAAGAGSSLPA
jgi:hypothetical protein